MVRKGGQAKIHKHFLSFYSSRMGFEGRPKPKEDPALFELQEAPLISARSKKIAEEARKKLLGENSSQDIVTQLYEKEKVRSQQKQLLAQEIAQRSLENDQSTFKPQTNHYSSGKQVVTHGDRCLDLYSRVKPGVYAAKNNVATDEAEFKKQEKECTHTPRLTTYNPTAADLSQIPGIELRLSRMKAAQAEKER